MVSGTSTTPLIDKINFILVCYSELNPKRDIYDFFNIGRTRVIPIKMKMLENCMKISFQP